MWVPHAICLVVSLSVGLFLRAEAIIRSATDYRTFVLNSDVSATFQLTGTVAYVLQPTQFVLDEGKDRLLIRHPARLAVSVGDRVSVRGTITHFLPGDNAPRTIWNSLHAETVSIIGKGVVPSPLVETTPSQIVSGRHYLHEVRLLGSVEDIVPDDVDPRWNILILREGSDAVLVPLPAGQDYSGLVDSRVAITGLCVFNIGSSRHQAGWSVQPSRSARLEVIEPAEARIARLPRLNPDQKIGPETVASLGRRQAVGTVLAVWPGRFLMADEQGAVLRVEADSLPPCGARVRAIGQADTDLFRINLSHAHVKVLNPPSTSVTLPTPSLGSDDIYDVLDGNTAFQLRNLGKPIALQGLVRTLPLPGVEGSRLTLDCGEIEVPVDATACPTAFDGLEPGAKVSVRGILVFETENWRSTKPLPRITGMFVSVCTPKDVVLLAAPPWWTPQRLAILIGGLLLGLFGILFWTFSLRRLAERRGRELAESAVDRAEAELRISERTRLAVELHDTIAQNLTGAALELRTIKRDSGTLTSESLHHLDVALKTINATREELRNCIWDLRNRALEAESFEEAIRLTLEPIDAGIPIRIRIAIPRERFTETTAHAMLSIIRELVSNAVRHGNAQSIAIAGAIEGDQLFFSVKDDGCGFDPETCPGQEQGHFGLQGVRERAKTFGGAVKISSRLGIGTKVTISVNLPAVEMP